MTTMLQPDEAASLDPGFQALTALAYREAGLVLSPGKAAMIKSRLRHRLKALGLDCLEDYCAYVSDNLSGPERRHMISALTTNVSGFFREPHHFDQLADALVPGMIDRLRAGQPVRIWSAGCSNGQEPYSIAMLLLEHDPTFGTGNCRILATDIDPRVIRFATDGIYDASQVAGLSADRTTRFTKQTTDSSGETKFTMNAELRKMITFKELNLIGSWPMKGRFDAIFCRNVVIYFDARTQESLWPRFADLLRPDGIVFVGHSERINTPSFRPAGATSYRRSGTAHAANPTQLLKEDG